MRTALCRFFVPAALSLAPVFASADSLLSVDINSDSVHPGTFSPTQAGFSAFNIPAAAGGSMISASYATDPLLTSGTTTVGIVEPGSAGVRSRDTGPLANTGAFTFGDLYRDYTFGQGGGGVLDINLSGLNPSRTYSVTFFAYAPDDTMGTTETFRNITPGLQPSPTSGADTYFGGDITSNYQHTVTLDGTADGGGNLNFVETGVEVGGPPDAGVLNGLQLAAAAPLPSSVWAGLALLGGLGLLTVRRRFQASK